MNRMRRSSMNYFLAAAILAAPCFAQQRFDSPEEAVGAVLQAAASHDRARMAAIFGPMGNSILTSGNASQDRAEQEEFSKLATKKHQLEPDLRDPNRMILAVGDEDWPFPVPLVKTKGKWAFDATETPAEMQARRIGAHELDAIEICAGFVDAERKYASEDRDKDGLLKYAMHVSSPLVPREFAEAIQDGQKKPAKPYHGYYFRILVGQGPHARGGAHSYLMNNMLVGGFGLVAWPAEYGVTGVHTFMVNQDGVVYQKDMAPAPGATFPTATRFDPDPSWTPVE